MSQDERRKNENTIDSNLDDGVGGGNDSGGGQTGIQGSQGKEQLQRWRQLGDQSETAGSGRRPGSVDQGSARWGGRPLGSVRRTDSRIHDGPQQGGPRQTGRKEKTTRRKEQSGRRKIPG